MRFWLTRLALVVVSAGVVIGIAACGGTEEEEAPPENVAPPEDESLVSTERVAAGPGMAVDTDPYERGEGPTSSYTNSTYGVRFRYPSTFVISDAQGQRFGIITLSQPRENIRIIVEVTPREGQAMEVAMDLKTQVEGIWEEAYWPEEPPKLIGVDEVDDGEIGRDEMLGDWETDFSTDPLSSEQLPPREVEYFEGWERFRRNNIFNAPDEIWEGFEGSLGGQPSTGYTGMCYINGEPYGCIVEAVTSGQRTAKVTYLFPRYTQNVMAYYIAAFRGRFDIQ